MRSQLVISSCGSGHYPRYASPEPRVPSSAAGLPSKHAIQANIVIMRAFAQLRWMLASRADLAGKLCALVAATAVVLAGAEKQSGAVA